MLAIGMDGYPRGWVVAVIEDGRLTTIETARNLAEALGAFPAAASIGIDIPIGLPEGPQPRAADLEARALLGRRAGTLFPTPPRRVIEAATHHEAIRMAREMGCAAPSAQAYALRTKILEVAPIAAADRSVFEVHPELAFRMLHGAPLAASKRTCAGLVERLAILEPLGLLPPGDFPGANRVPADDVLDAVVTAWVAWNHAMGQARSLPASGGEHPHHRIWYVEPS